MEWLGCQTVSNYGSFSLRDIKLNHALVIANTTLRDIGVYVAEDDCFGCPYTLQHDLDNETHWQVDTSFATTWRLMKKENYKYANSKSLRGLICELRPTLGEFGVYRLQVGTCELREEVSPINPYLPLLLSISTLISLGCLQIFIQILYKYLKRIFKSKNVAPHCEEKILSKTQPTKKFLYVFRGILFSSIIFLTSGAGGYSILTKEYGGISFAEIAFYALLWSVGFKIPLTVQKVTEKNDSKSILFKGIAKKSAALIIIGLTIDSTIAQCQQKTFPIWRPIQKIGIGYFISAFIYVFTKKKYDTKAKNFSGKIVGNFIPLAWCWMIGSFLMSILFILLTTVWAINFQSSGNFVTPNISRSNNIEDVINYEINYIARYMNSVLLARDGYVCLNQYYSLNSGLIGVLVSSLHCLIGLKAGMVYLLHKGNKNRERLWCFWGGFFVTAGVMLVGVSYVVKFNLWPLSTILIISGSSFFGLSLTYSFIEKFQITSIYMSSLGELFVLILSGHMLLSNSFPFSFDFNCNNHLVYLMKNLWTLLLWASLAVFLSNRGVKFPI